MNILEISLLCGASACILALVLSPLAIRFANIFGLLDAPGLRKIHSAPVPRVGGIAIAIGALVPFSAAVWLCKVPLGHAEAGMLLTLLAAAACVLVLGFVDDIVNVQAKLKLLALLGATAMFCGSGGLIHNITFSGAVVFHMGRLAWPVTMMWILGIMVSVNFIDGLDGLAAGIVAIAAVVLAIGAAVGGATSSLFLAISLIGALGGFLFFNFNPASIFMGDCGSFFIGFVLAAACVMASQNPGVGTTRGILLPSMTLSIPLLDCALTMIRRGVLQRQSLFTAERGHIHHRLLDIGLIHKHVVLLLYGITLIAACVASVTYLGSVWATSLTAGGFCFALAMLFKTAGSVQARETLRAIRRNRAMGRQTRYYQAVFDELRLGFCEVNSFEGWWKQVCRSAERLDFAKVDLPMVSRKNSSTTIKWRKGESEIAAEDSLIAEVPIRQRRAGSTMRIEVEVLVSKFLENAGYRLALFSRLMSEFSLAELPNSASPRSAQSAEGIADVEFADTIEVDASVTEAVKMFSNLRVAIVHDFLYTYAGAERVLEQLISLFPKSDLFSLFDFLPDNMRGFIRRKPVKPSFLQKMPFARRRHRAYLPLMPLAIEQIDVSSYDLIVTSSYMVAKGVLTRPDQLHICYCHTPVRFAWDIQKQQLRTGGPITLVKSLAARLVLHYIRNWDVRSANNVDVFVTNSNFVGRRIDKYYRRSSTTIYPPVDIDWFKQGDAKSEFYLTASRLVAYKRIDLIVEAFNAMPNRILYVIGDGPELARLSAKANSNVRVIGFQTAEKLREYMQRARAFVFAAEEDFGIAPCEAQACGTPVIAYGRGGVTESIIHLKTGYLFQEQTVESLVKAVEDFETHTWDCAEIRKNAERFSIQQFRQNFVEIVKMEWALFLASKIEAQRDRQLGVGPGLPGWQQPGHPKPLPALEFAPGLKKNQDNAVA
jgi:UDP-N-acetylmuramyl pentapeptide phosphotransferase/UDP-N-acetylglucosamine-1-phosphate transferase/glycosyltransferase involved in cell wall biosynthesis